MYIVNNNFFNHHHSIFIKDNYALEYRIQYYESNISSNKRQTSNKRHTTDTKIKVSSSPQTSGNY